jgi:hypothetical protein
MIFGPGDNDLIGGSVEYFCESFLALPQAVGQPAVFGPAFPVLTPCDADALIHYSKTVSPI